MIRTYTSKSSQTVCLILCLSLFAVSDTAPPSSASALKPAPEANFPLFDLEQLQAHRAAFRLLEPHAYQYVWKERGRTISFLNVLKRGDSISLFSDGEAPVYSANNGGYGLDSLFGALMEQASKPGVGKVSIKKLTIEFDSTYHFPVYVRWAHTGPDNVEFTSMRVLRISQFKKFD